MRELPAPAEAHESDGRQPSRVERFVAPFFEEPTLWPVLLVLAAHAVLIGAVAIAFGVRDRNPFALAALALLGVATVDVCVRLARALHDQALRLGDRCVLARLRTRRGRRIVLPRLLNDVRAIAVAAIALAAALAALAGADDGAGKSWLLDDPALRELAPADLAARPARFPFPVGERLVYAVSWFGVPAGTAVIEVARYVALGETRLAHVVATAETNALFSLIYPLRDRSEAWIDLDRAVTVRTRALERRSGKLYDESVVYDWSTHFLHARLDKLHKGQRREVAFDFGPFAHDTSDAVFALRALPLAAGFAAGLPTYANRKLFELRIEVAPGPRVDRTPIGDVETLAVRPSTWLDGTPHAAGEGVVLVAGPARVPVRLEGWIRTPESSFLARGLRAELTGYTPSAPGWRPAHAPALDARAAMPSTRDGVPLWEPPPALRAARAAAGVVAGERSSRFGVAQAPP